MIHKRTDANANVALCNDQILAQIGDKQFALVENSNDCIASAQDEEKANSNENDLNQTISGQPLDMSHPEIPHLNGIHSCLIFGYQESLESILKPSPFEYEEIDEEAVDDTRGCCDIFFGIFRRKRPNSHLEDTKPPLLANPM
jgi:hypothetical protein